jgi:aspartyl/asparaginyl beta-hydroxylase (cupin superfamily)
LNLLDEWGVAWDKRLSYAQWRRIAAYLLDFENCSAAERDFLAQQTRLAMRQTDMRPEALFMRLQAMGALTSDEEVLQSARAATGMLGIEDTSLPPRFAQYVAGLSEDLDEPRMMMYPGLSSSPWYDARLFPLARDLERMAWQITKEFASLDRARFQSESEGIKREGDWDVMLLVERGRRNRELCDACPITMRIIESHRTVLGLAGLAYFSRLAPHTRVAPHRGPTNMRLRCHLGIKIPAGCGIVVGGSAGQWETGKCLVFDDSQLHHVWNDSDSERIVLIVDLWHPDLTDREVELLEGLHTYADAHARNLAKYWEKNARTREGAVLHQPMGAH